MEGSASGRGWLRSRLPVEPGVLKEKLLGETMPQHMKNWWFATGGVPFFLFFTLAATGILLTFNYVPEPPRAYESVAAITNKIPFGVWVRSLHKWSAEFMVITLILHVLRVTITGAFRKPRELTWIVGAVLLLCTFLAAFTGYSLVYTHQSYWAAVVGANIAENIPLVGSFVANFLRGGPEVTPETWHRFFGLHAVVLPLTILGLVVLHIALVRLHGVAEIPGANNEKTYRFYPEHLLTEAIVFLGLLFTFTVLAIVAPPTLGPMADPLVTPLHTKPEWYFYWIYRWLKLTPSAVGILVPLALAAVFVFWPLVDGWIRKRLPRKEYHYPLVAAVVALVLIAMTVWESLSY